MIDRAGVIAMQGDVREHVVAIESAFDSDVSVAPIRSAEAIARSDLLVLPGGESTTISRLLRENDLRTPIRAHVEANKPILATCAGLIVAARNVADDRVETLDILDVSVDRNAYGRQRESFETQLEVTGLDTPYPGVFIRAPRIREADGAEVIAQHAGEPVAVRQGPVVGACFHPELTGDPRIHRLAVTAEEARR